MGRMHFLYQAVLIYFYRIAYALYLYPAAISGRIWHGCTKINWGSKDLKAFNLLNYAPIIERMAKENDQEQGSHYEAWLQGALDMFSL